MNTVHWLSYHFLLPFAIIHLLSVVIINPFLMPKVYKAHKLEKSARKIFKLAAEMVTDATNGFTDRPYYAGQENYSKNEVIGFARYLSGKDIVRYRVTPQSADMGFSMGLSALADKSFQRVSNISFANDGKIMVQISEQD